MSKKNNLSVLMLLMALPPCKLGGAEMQALRLSKRLRDEGINVIIAGPSEKEHKIEKESGIEYIKLTLAARILKFKTKKKPQTPTKIEYDLKNQEVFSQRVSYKSYLIGIVYFLNSLTKLLGRKNEFDIIHVHTMEWLAIVGILLGKIFRKPVLIKDSTMNSLIKMKKMPHGEFLQKIVVEDGSFVAMTEKIKRNFELCGVLAEKIFKIPNGIESENIKPVLLLENFHCLFIGNLYQQPAKGVDILLKAWVIVSKNFPKAKLNVIGDGDIPAYQKYLKELKIERSVTLLGKQSDPKEFFKETHLFVLPSRREGMSNALIEAMAFGLPSVVTDISGSQDLIIQDINGLIVEVEDIDGLAEAISIVFNDFELAKRMGFNAHLRIKEICDINLVTQKYIEAYNKILIT